MARTTRSNQTNPSVKAKPSTNTKPSSKAKAEKVLNHLRKAEKRQAFDETIREALVAKMMML
jgi:hypothetical protein